MRCLINIQDSLDRSQPSGISQKSWSIGHSVSFSFSPEWSWELRGFLLIIWYCAWDRDDSKNVSWISLLALIWADLDSGYRSPSLGFLQRKFIITLLSWYVLGVKEEPGLPISSSCYCYLTNFYRQYLHFHSIKICLISIWFFLEP